MSNGSVLRLRYFLYLDVCIYSNILEMLCPLCPERRAVAVNRSNSQSGFPQKDEEEKFKNSEKFAEK